MLKPGKWMRVLFDSKTHSLSATILDVMHSINEAVYYQLQHVFSVPASDAGEDGPAIMQDATQVLKFDVQPGSDGGKTLEGALPLPLFGRKNRVEKLPQTVSSFLRIKLATLGMSHQRLADSIDHQQAQQGPRQQDEACPGQGCLATSLRARGKKRTRRGIFRPRLAKGALRARQRFPRRRAVCSAL